MRARASFSLALAVSVGSLLAAGCGSGTPVKTAAARCDAPVGVSSNANGVLWAQGGSKPAVYAVAGSKVIAPSGTTSVPAGATAVGFWACRPYSLLYTSGGQLRMDGGTEGPTTIGTNGVAAPNGWLLTFNGATISYTNGEKLVARGLKPGWRISAVTVDPKDPHTVFATAISPRVGNEECLFGDGVVYRVTPTTTSAVLKYNPSRTNPLVSWSPDGTHMSFTDGPQSVLYIGDVYGRTKIAVARDVGSFLWSPDGSTIAYNVAAGSTPRVALIDVAAGTSRPLADGTLGAWSPDGKAVAVISGSSLLGVPAAGGHPQKLASLS